MADRQPPAGDAQEPSALDVLHWYDLVCPFCYLAQTDNRALVARGVRLVELGFAAHPEIPEEGIYVGPRRGAMYVEIERRAAASGLPLRWPDRLPNTRLALGAVEWARSNAPSQADALRVGLFAAHFAEGENIGHLEIVLRRGASVGISEDLLEHGISDGSAGRLLQAAELLGRSAGVAGTPAWLAGDRLITGLQPGSLYDRLGVDPA